MAEQTDVVLLGIGTSGEDLALRLLRAGLKVVGIEPQLIAVNALIGHVFPPR